MHGHTVLVVEGWSEEELRALHSDFSWNGDNVLIWKSVLHVLVRAGLDLGLVVLSNVALRLLNGSGYNKLFSRVKVVASLSEKKSLAIIAQRASTDVHLLDGICHGDTIADWRDIGGTITRVDDNTSGFSSSKERHGRLESDVCILDSERIK